MSGQNISHKIKSNLSNKDRFEIRIHKKSCFSSTTSFNSHHTVTPYTSILWQSVVSPILSSLAVSVLLPCV